MKFGASAVIALLHDVSLFFCLCIVRIPVGNTFIACMLTIVGYSINATIVIFDRIRENRKLTLQSRSGYYCQYKYYTDNFQKYQYIFDNIYHDLCSVPDGCYIYP